MTPKHRLVKFLTNITLVGAVCRMFGANIYARIRVVHALGYVISAYGVTHDSFGKKNIENLFNTSSAVKKKIDTMRNS